MGLLDRLRGKETPGNAVNRVMDATPAKRISKPIISSITSTSASSMLGDLRRAADVGYNGSALAFRCVQAIASNASSLDLVIERRDSAGVMVPVDGHPTAELFNRYPNSAMSARMFKEIIWAQLELAGEAFVYLDRGESGEGPITALWPIFDPVAPVVSKRIGGELQGHVVKVAGGRQVPLLPGEVLWLRYPSPRSAWGSVSPFRAAALALELDSWAKAWQLGELRNGARPEGVIYLGDVDEDTHNRIVASFRSAHEGPRNANRHLFVSGTVPAQYSRIGLTPAEVSYTETRAANNDEVFLAFGVPHDYLMGGTTFENRTAARRTLWSDTIVPKLELVAGEIDRQLLPDRLETCRFDTSNVDALAENEESISRRVREQMYADVLMVDEGRERVGLKPLADGLGQFTITAYREAVRVRAAVALQQMLASPSSAPALEAGTRALEAQLLVRARRVAKPLPIAEIEREYDRLEAIGQRAVKRLAEKQERVVLQKLDRSKAGQLLQHSVELYDAAEMETVDAAALVVRQQVSDVFDEAYWREYTREALGDTIVASAYDSGASRTAASLGISFDLFEPAVLSAMRDRADVLAGLVTQTTRDALELAILDPGVAAGESVPKLADRLRSVFAELSTSRAEMIARTETVGGFNASSRTAAVESGVVKARKWLATSDARTRDTHNDQNGHETQGMDDAYPNGLMHPGDPSGPPRETVNCRCVETYIIEEGD